jgi:alpha-beta hydrolase superfamily lysophospholipase
MTVPTLLVVGSRDAEVLAACEWAMEQMRCRKSLAIVPGASHLFIEKGTLASVATLAAEWFDRHLVREETRAPSPPTPARRSKS